MPESDLTLTRRQITEWSRLTQKKYRREQGEFLIEGELCVFEALRAKKPVQAVIVLRSESETFAARPEFSRVPIYPVNAEIFQRFTKPESSQGILAVGKTFSLPPRQGNLAVACEQVSDPGNCGALIRVACFFGASELHLGPDSAEIWNGKVVRGSMGSIFHQPVRADANLAELISHWPGSSVALVSHGGQPLKKTMNLKPPVLLVLGHETRGMSDELARLCSHCLTLESHGPAESLNLVTAAAVFCYALS